MKVIRALLLLSYLFYSPSSTLPSDGSVQHISSITAVISATGVVISYLSDVKDAPKEKLALTDEAKNLLDLFLYLRDRAEEAEKDQDFQKNKSGSTPLALATRRGRKAMVVTLISCGADVNTHGSFGRSPLVTGLERALEFIARLLIAKGADLDSEVAENGQELLLRIMDYEPGKTGPENLIKLLVIEKKVNVSFTDRYGLKPLGGAAISGYENIVKILIEEGGASLDPRDRIGRAPLALALEAGHKSVVELLIEKGAELNTEDDKHLTPLTWARALSTRMVGQMPRHDREEIVKLMIDPKLEDVLDPWEIART